VSAGEWSDALLGAEGQQLLDQLSTESLAPENEVRLITRLRAAHSIELVSAALAQAKLRVKARGKFECAASMYFTQSGLEQASSARMARHHASRYAPFPRMADLCSGIGGDLIGLAADREVIAVDVDPIHSRIGRLNAEANGVASRVSSVCADVRHVNLSAIPAVFVDPARRSTDRRFRAGLGEPPLDWCFGIAEGGIGVGIKAAPGLPTERVPDGWELEFVSEHRELKESVLWSPSLSTARRRATILPEGHTLTVSPDAPDVHLHIRPPGAFLLDPDPAVTRSGLVEALGQSLGGCWKIDDQVAFLSADHPMFTPFGRSLRIDASMPWSLARLKDSLRGLDIGTVDIRKRGSAVDVDEIQRRLKLTGSRMATVVLTRVVDQPWAFVCSFVVQTAAT
jgi:hypothetical protein